MKSHLMVVLLALGMGALACGQAPKGPPAFTGSFNPIPLTDDLSQIDLCTAIPQEAMEEALGRSLSESPARFAYYDDVRTSGCIYVAESDPDGEAHFGYVALTPASLYDEQPLYLDEPVSGIGDSAYLNNGADARQLWVKVGGGRAAFVVAVGDVPREEQIKKIGMLLAAALQ